MQSKKMRFLAAALAGAMAISMAACGSRDDDGAGAGGDDGSSVAATSDAAGSDAAGSDAAGSDAAGSDAAGSDAAGSDAAGSDAAGSDAAGSDATAPASGSEGAGSGAGAGPAEGEDPNIKIAYIPWDEDIVVTYLWQNILTELGYKVEIQQLDVSPTFDAVANDKADLYFDVWLPLTHASQWEKYSDQVEDLGVWYDQATLNIAVPEYMTDVNTIADLAKVADQVNGKITGIESGAGLTGAIDKALDAYGLDDLEQQTSSTPAMLAALEKATKAEEPIVVALWHPHWAYSAYPIKDLEDPDGVMGDKEEIHVIGNQGFTEDHPGVAAMIKNFTMSDEQLADLENKALVENKDDPEAGVQAWIDENQDFVAGLTG